MLYVDEQATSIGQVWNIVDNDGIIYAVVYSSSSAAKWICDLMNSKLAR